MTGLILTDTEQAVAVALVLGVLPLLAIAICEWLDRKGR